MNYNKCASLAIIILALILEASGGQSCILREIDEDSKKLVCVCNEIYCGNLTFEWPQQSGQASQVQSTRSGLRFQQGNLVTPRNNSTDSIKISIDLDKRYQSILGWGGAFTDATGINLSNLTENLANTLLEGYYGEGGLQYNFGRVPIAGSDFSTRAYSYDDRDEPDYNLTHWSLAPEDTLYKIPYIKKAIEAQERMGMKLNLLASPWSPPAWMKTNNNLVSGKLIGEDRVFKSYAEYLMKFYDAYKEYEIKFWGATVQNEPLLATKFKPNYTFNSLEFDTENITKFIGKFLGPALKDRGYTRENFKLMAGDDQLGLINSQVPKILEDSDAAQYISGLAFHWYFSGKIVPYSALEDVYNTIKDKIEFSLMTEACEGSFPEQKPKVDLGNWERGQAYASDIIEDLQRFAGGWIDWNLALDQEGGPNWVQNFVDSPIIVNSQQGEFYQQPMYHVLAHFSRLFRPGSVRVGFELEGNSTELLVTAVHNQESGHLIVNILNKSDKYEKIELSITGQERNHTTSISGKSMNSIVVKL